VDQDRADPADIVVAAPFTAPDGGHALRVIEGGFRLGAEQLHGRAVDVPVLRPGFLLGFGVS
jgi:hypothetical protein